MAPNRKLIGFDPEILQALELLSRDSGKDLQALADEAFADLLAKHHRPRTLKDALKQSARREPANENRPPKTTRLLSLLAPTSPELRDTHGKDLTFGSKGR